LTGSGSGLATRCCQDDNDNVRVPLKAITYLKSWVTIRLTKTLPWGQWVSRI